MKIVKTSRAGTLESSDIYVILEPNDGNGIEINLDSIVMKQFGKQIRNVIIGVLNEFDVEDVKVTAKDRGALDYTIRARVETAIKRGCECK